jgi:hypothetical protein
MLLILRQCRVYDLNKLLDKFKTSTLKIFCTSKNFLFRTRIAYFHVLEWPLREIFPLVQERGEIAVIQNVL